VTYRFCKDLSAGGCVAPCVRWVRPKVEIRGADFEGQRSGQGDCDLSTARHREP
jgi:hypothetical protein